MRRAHNFSAFVVTLGARGVGGGGRGDREEIQPRAEHTKLYYPPTNRRTDKTVQTRKMPPDEVNNSRNTNYRIRRSIPLSLGPLHLVGKFSKRFMASYSVYNLETVPGEYSFS